MCGAGFTVLITGTAMVSRLWVNSSQKRWSETLSNVSDFEIALVDTVSMQGLEAEDMCSSLSAIEHSLEHG